MALSATICKLELQVSDLDRHYYQTHRLTLAQHPSETALRLMVRILVFALNAEESLAFTRGLSTEEEPDLWSRNLAGGIEHWIDLGQPDVRRLKKACRQSTRVSVYSYGGQSARIWWQKNQSDCARLPGLKVVGLPAEQLDCLVPMLSRSMQLQCTSQSGFVWVTDGHKSCEITPQVWQERTP